MDSQDQEEKRHGESTKEPEHTRPKFVEDFYDNFSNVPLKVLDIIIWVCVAALIAIFVYGFLTR